MAASLRRAVVCASLMALPGGFPVARAQENASAQRLVAEPWKTPPPPILSTGGFAGVSHGRLLLAGRAPETLLSVWTFPATPSPGTNEQWESANVTVPAWAATTPWRYGLIVAGDLLGGKPTGQVVLLTVNGDTVTASPLPPLPRPLAGAGAAVVGTKLYIFGGASSVEPPGLEKTLWTLEPGVAGGAWHGETGKVFPAAGRAFAAVAGQYGALCVAGGVTGENGALSAVTGMNALVSVLLMGLLTTVYTALGGSEAVSGRRRSRAS